MASNQNSIVRLSVLFKDLNEVYIGSKIARFKNISTNNAEEKFLFYGIRIMNIGINAYHGIRFTTPEDKLNDFSHPVATTSFVKGRGL